MSIKPILFNSEEVRATLDRRKTCTRRPIKPRYRDDEAGFQILTTKSGEFLRVEKVDEDECGIFSDGTERYVLPPYEPGDILWVRETWYYENHMYQNNEGDALYRYVYRASSPEYPVNVGVGEHGWKPSIHMPREAARLWLRVENVRVERLQEISADQCYSEGVEKEAGEVGAEFTRGIFSGIWDSTIKKADLPLYGWAANPWVWVFEFERCEKPQEDKQ